MPWCNKEEPKPMYSQHRHRDRQQGYPASSSACDIYDLVNLLHGATKFPAAEEFRPRLEFHADVATRTIIQPL
jgi:hypothetical protein